MTNDPRLERFLTSLERALKPFPVSDRAEIVTEIKSHILDALERDPATRLDTVLSALGEPETVANRYLLERGLKTAKPPVSPIVKWLVVGFLGTFAMILIFTGFVISRFGPLVHVDEKKDKVTLLGGLLEVDGDKGHVYFKGTIGSGDQYNGVQTVNPGQQINVKFNSGKFDITNADGTSFIWNCRGRGTEAPISSLTDKEAALDLTTLSGAKCELQIPSGTKLLVNGQNGKIEFTEPLFGIDADLSIGKIAMKPNEGTNYRYNLNVGTGKVDSFDSSDKADALEIKIHVGTGKISRSN